MSETEEVPQEQSTDQIPSLPEDAAARLRSPEEQSRQVVEGVLTNLETLKRAVEVSKPLVEVKLPEDQVSNVRLNKNAEIEPEPPQDIDS